MKALRQVAHEFMCHSLANGESIIHIHFFGCHSSIDNVDSHVDSPVDSGEDATKIAQKETAAFVKAVQEPAVERGFNQPLTKQGKFETKSPNSLRWSGVLKRVGMETEPMLKKYKTPHKLIFRCGCSVCYPANPYRTIIKHVRKHLDNDETYQNKSSFFPEEIVSQRFVCQSICIN